MFRKAQFRFFGIIISILLAIFIAVLGSINVITQELMKKQTLVVLENIASGVEYDEVNARFTFTPPDNEDFRKKFGYDRRLEEPPSKPSGQPGTDYEPTEETTAAETETSAVNTVSQENVTLPPEKPSYAGIESQTQGIETTGQPPELQKPSASYSYNDDDDNDDDGDDDDDQNETVTAPVKPTEPPVSQWEEERRRRDEERKQREEKKREEQLPQPPDWSVQPPTFPQWQQFGENECDPNKQFGWYWCPPGEWEAEDTAAHEVFTAVPLTASSESTSSTAENTTAPAEDIPPPDNGEPMPMDGKKNGEDRYAVPKSLGSIDFFVVMADTSGNYLATLNNDDLSQETAQQYITEIISCGYETGMLNKTYQFYQAEKPNGTLIVLTDKSREIQMQKNLTRTTIVIGMITLIVLSVFAFFLSRKIMQPLKLAFEKQKQFISDASHELKTPLTVISANADVLSGEIGENKWLTYIKSQTDRMNVLVNDLLNLTRLENNTSNFIRTDFDLSKAITNTALPFECQAFESGKKFIVDVEDGLTVNGSEQHIRQMAAIFIDNALKYAKDGGLVRVTLKKQNDKKVLSVYNTGSGVREEEVDKIFERFYRSDSSRNRSTGGYGLGLAIAKSIIDKHKFKVYVDNAEGKSICFIVTM